MEAVPDMDDLLDSLEDPLEVDKNNDSSSIDRSMKSDDNRLFMDSGSITKSSCFKENILKVEEEIDKVEEKTISNLMHNSSRTDLEDVEKNKNLDLHEKLKDADSSNPEVDSVACDVKINFKANDPDSIESGISDLNIESVKNNFNSVDSGASEVIEKFEFAASSPSESVEVQAPNEKIKVNLSIKEVSEKVDNNLPNESTITKEESNSDPVNNIPVENVPDETKVEVEIEESKDMDKEETIGISESDIPSENETNISSHKDITEEVSEGIKEEIVLENSKEDTSSGDQTTDYVDQEVPEESLKTEETIEIPKDDVSSETETNISIHKNISEEIVQNQNPEEVSQVRDPSNPVGFDSTSNLSPEEDLQLQKELEEMEAGNIPEEVVIAVTESANESNINQEESQPNSSIDIQSAPEENLSRDNQHEENLPKDGSRQKKASVVMSTHDLSEFNYNPILTESERQLGKMKPYWIPDEDCNNCMLCSLKFTVINRRHHCRCCGRVLCNACCSVKRPLPYIEDPEKKQKVCEPCSRTLDRIEELERIERETSTSRSNNRVSGNPGSEPWDIESSEPGPSSPTPGSYNTLNRKKSVLKSKKNDSIPEEPGSEKKRSVKFLDGVRPGHETESSDDPGPSRASASQGEQPVENIKKIQKRPGSNKRFREKRIEEEQFSLIRDDVIYLADADSQLVKSSIDIVCRKLLNGEKLTFGIKKNYCVAGQLVQTLNGKVWSFSTRGMAAVGADELLLNFEAGEEELKNLEDTIKEFEDQKTSESKKQDKDVKGNEEYSNQNKEISDYSNEETDDKEFGEDKKQCFIHSMLYLFEHFFIESLIPASDNLDEKVGIRRCGSRMCKFYHIPSGEIGGIPVAAVIFHRPQGQDFSSFSIPFNIPFLVGSFILKQELVWAMTIPNRLLLRFGLQSSHFPVPIVNKRNRDAVYSDSSENSVLKVFNDFKNWTYRFPRIMGSTVEIEDGCLVKVHIPTFGTEELKQVIDCNRNMLAWSTELTDHPDSHLVAIQNMETRTFRTEIFTDVGGTRQNIGANFVVIDGSLKNSSEKFLMTIIEDGVVLRFSSETMEEIVKNLQNGLAFTIKNSSMSVKIIFVDPYEPESKTGALISPIDDMYLLGHYQYGLTLSRQFRSQIPIPGTTDWALRLSTVINADRGRFPLQLQPRYFEICEQIGILIASTVEQFIQPLTLSEQKQICIRIRIESDSVTYETAKWHGLDQEQYQWTGILDDKLIPYLYQLCPLISLQLYIELYFSIISTRLLQNIDY